MRKQLLVLAAALCSAACTTTVAGTPRPVTAPAASGGPTGQVSQYFSELNTAGGQGPSAQRDFLQRTQHPDFSDQMCNLGDLTLREQPAMSTLREDKGWHPEGSSRTPRGQIYVVAVSVSVLRNGAALGEQIGLERLVLLDGKVYGFAPCPTG